MVDEDSHPNPALVRGQQRFEEPPRRVIDGDDVELEVDEPSGRIDLVGHRLHAGVVVDLQIEGVAVRHRQRAQFEVELRRGAQRFGHVGGVADDRPIIGLVPEDVVDEHLFVPPPLRQLRRAEQQERENSDVGDEEDCEQPAERDRWSAVVRNPAQRNDADDHVDRQKCDNQPVRPRLID